MECIESIIIPNSLSSEPRRIPMSGTFELTVRCNLHCKMCLFRHEDKQNAEIMGKELTTEQWIQMGKDVADAGTINLLITGGEPMLRSDFCEIWEGIYKQGFLITLYTNATLITPQIMSTLRKYPPHTIGVTIYGATSETYGKVCGDTKAFERAISGIHQLQELPSIMEFRTTIIKDNYCEADEIEKLVHEEYRLIQTRIVTKAVRGASADVEECRLEPEENVRLAFRRGINHIKEQVGESYDERHLYVQHLNRSEDKVYAPKLTLLGCNAGMSSYTISWDGKLLGCQMLGKFAVDAMEKGFAEAWINFPQVVKLPPISKKCINCKSLDICNCCYASRYAETGDLGGCPDYVCRDTAIISRMLNRGGE